MGKKPPFAKAAKGALGGKQRIMTAPPAPMLGGPPAPAAAPPTAPPMPPRPIGNAGSALGMALAAARAKRANGGM